MSKKLFLDEKSSWGRDVTKDIKHTQTWTEDKAYDLEFAREMIRETIVIYSAVIHMLKFAKSHNYIWDDPDCITQLKAKIVWLKKERKHLVWYDEKKIRSVFKECNATLIKYRNLIKNIFRLSRLAEGRNR